ncbi:hypothetical protein OQ968_11285 [Mycobacterium sp. 663a-19]|uniref:hypothetical protein n=1 Tax=Mycobacterium sp. 663a-19 TaxID=2986148 RepID=UPI002D1F84DD|nr:hypothetical protein [Mycobacterium sp. 663a-19]MEB3981848.1 hypothetical protein [Mycobacterium sp. 663a-19]
MTKSVRDHDDVDSRLPDRRARIYVGVAIGLLTWAALGVFLAATVVNVDTYLFSYYAADYTFGFVRRGLAGEMINLFPAGSYFTAATVLRWASSAVYSISLAAVAWLVLSHGGRSERRIMLALLIPVLPFGFAFAIAARPDLFGAAVFVAYAIALVYARSPRAITACSAAYGISIAVLALAHEGVVFELSLGAILAILVLARRAAPNVQRLGAVLAIGPGVISALCILFLGRHGISSQLCSRVPHKSVGDALTNPSFSKGVDYFILGHRPQVDYHDWVCHNITKMNDYGVGHFIGIVAGNPSLRLMSLVLGLAAVALTLYLIGYFSKVPFGEFTNHIRGRSIWVLLGVALAVPLFLAALDWVRWCTFFSLDIGVVYILYALNSPQLQGKPTPKEVRVFVCVVVALALFPIGTEA